jgi:hypothetical protein
LSLQHTRDSTWSPENVQVIAEELAASPRKYKVFAAIYSGGGKPKSANDLVAIAEKISTPWPTNRKLEAFNEVTILQLATPMANKHYFEKVKDKGRTAFKKYADVNAMRHNILRQARNKKLREKTVTVRNPKHMIAVRIDTRKTQEIRLERIFIDQIDQFKKVKSLHASKLADLKPKRLPEKVFKYGVAAILGNKGKFQDWGGEKNDLYSCHVTIKGQRISTAFAFKGPATPPPLTPKKLGKNGNQIQKLFESSAEAFFIQFEGRIDESVIEQMQTHAIAKSYATRKKILFGVIALEDSHRLRMKYASSFTEESFPSDDE